MSMTTVEFKTGQNPPQTSFDWKSGRLVVYTSGEDAGLLRLDMDLEGIETAEQAKHSVKLSLPGELNPLDARNAVGENGRFIVSYFSSDIANAGHLPANAVVRWTSSAKESLSRSVDAVAAEKVECLHNGEAPGVSRGRPADMYPKTVGLLTVLAVVFLMTCVIAFLMLGDF